MKKINFLIFLISVGFYTDSLSLSKMSSVNSMFTNLSPNDSIFIKKPESKRKMFERKGSVFFYWGYDREKYTKSDIHFWGHGYDFTIKNISATDDQSKFSTIYINPNTLSVPQYNFRLGYYLNNKYFITIGNDHMKYHMLRQPTRLTGNISNGINAGTYNNAEVVVGEEMDKGVKDCPNTDSLQGEFVPEFEHCDGLNNINIELGRNDDFWVSRNGNYALSSVTMIGLGGALTDTEAEVLGVHDQSHTIGGMGFHLSGFHASASIGLQFNFFKHFFLLGRAQGGWVYLADINTTMENGKASQHFGFLQTMMVVGYTHIIGKRK